MGKKSKRVREGTGVAASKPVPTVKPIPPPKPDIPQVPPKLRKEILDICNKMLDKCSQPFGSGNQEWEDFMSLYEMIQDLRQKQEGYTIPLSNREDHFEEFINWLQVRGVDTSAVSIAEFDTAGFGLKATKDIEQSDMFISVPRKLMMTSDTAKRSNLASLIREDRLLQAMPNVVLALHLLCEKMNLQSYWAPYLNILPSTYNTPLYFSPEELDHLKGSPTLTEILNQWRSIARQYAYFYRLFHTNQDASNIPIKDFCFDDYRWAVSTVMTRLNQIPTAGGGHVKVMALIPLWDMCNHCMGQITTDYNDKKDSGDCYALKNFKKGEQIYIFYGDRSNSELLIHNGFICDDNECDKYTLKLGVSKNDPCYDIKAQLLTRLKLAPTYTFEIYTGEDPVDSDLLSYLRVFNMEEDLLKVCLGGDGKKMLKKLKLFDEMLSKDNEIKVWHFLETRCRLLLRSYPTSIAEDRIMLKEEEMSPTVQLMVRLRLGEKEILQSTQSYAASQVRLVESWLPSVGDLDIGDDD